MNYRLIALDIDGTLLTNDDELTPRVRRAIRKAQERGVYITLATGRRYSRTLPWANALGITQPIVTHNGAVIVDPTSEKVIYQQGIPASLYKPLISELQREKLMYFVYTGKSGGEEILMENELFQRGKYQIMRYVGDSVSPVDKLHLDSDPVKIALIEPSGNLESRISDWERRYGVNMNMMVFGAPSHEHMGVEFLAEGCTKARGVEFVLNQLGLDFSQVIAFGDDVNDLELVSQAGLGVAMLNASDKLRQHANYITGSNQEDGVAQVLEDVLGL